MRIAGVFGAIASLFVLLAARLTIEFVDWDVRRADVYGIDLKPFLLLFVFFVITAVDLFKKRIELGLLKASFPLFLITLALAGEVIFILGESCVGPFFWRPDMHYGVIPLTVDTIALVIAVFLVVKGRKRPAWGAF